MSQARERVGESRLDRTVFPRSVGSTGSVGFIRVGEAKASLNALSYHPTSKETS